MINEVIQDAVHGMIELEPIVRLILDTPEFQRLREIRQLGLAHLVFPSCQHTRFEHSLGTYHMAKRLLETLCSHMGSSEAALTQGEVMSVKIAALCHDLGHGPYSHVWEHFIKRGGPKYRTYKHEQISCKIFDRIWMNNPKIAKAFDEAQVDTDLVKRLIWGKAPINTKKLYMYEILSNDTNGIDVDKWDYLLRDCLHAGLGSSTIDVDRILRFCRPVPHPKVTASGELEALEDAQWHLSFMHTELENVLATLELRQQLHQKMVRHKTSILLDQMVMDTLDLTEQILQLREISWRAYESDKPEALEAYLQLHDHLLWDIYHRRYHSPTLSATDIASLDQARELVHRLLTRQLYHYVGSVFEAQPSKDNEAAANGTIVTNRLTNNLRYVLTSMGVQKPLMTETLSPNCRIIARWQNRGEQDIGKLLLDGVFAKLPSDTTVHDKRELLVATSTFSSNSTRNAPQFYFHTQEGRTFVYQEPLRSIKAFRVYWRGPMCDKYSSCKTNHENDVVEQLTEALNQWHEEYTSVQNGVHLEQF